MDAILSEKAARLIQERLERGPYRTAAEVIEDALDALEFRENYDSLVAAIDEADRDLAEGRYEDFDADSIHELADRVKERGLAKLLQESGHSSK